MKRLSLMILAGLLCVPMLVQAEMREGDIYIGQRFIKFSGSANNDWNRRGDCKLAIDSISAVQNNIVLARYINTEDSMNDAAWSYQYQSDSSLQFAASGEWFGGSFNSFWSINSVIMLDGDKNPIEVTYYNSIRRILSPDEVTTTVWEEDCRNLTKIAE